MSITKWPTNMPIEENINAILDWPPSCIARHKDWQAWSSSHIGQASADQLAQPVELLAEVDQVANALSISSDALMKQSLTKALQV
jgi:hypothetical protein